VAAGRPIGKTRGIAHWGMLGAASQFIFIAGWFSADFLQGGHYSAIRYDVSEMASLTAPHAWLLLACQGLAGAGTIAFALFGLRPALMITATAGRSGPWLLVLSALGLDNLSDAFFRLDCRTVDGCTGISWHAQLHNIVGTVTIVVLVIAPFIIARRLRQAPEWTNLAAPSIVVGGLLVTMWAATLLTHNIGFEGLFQRALLFIAAAWVAALALRLSTSGQRRRIL
jgi:hypothetical protein